MSQQEVIPRKEFLSGFLGHLKLEYISSFSSNGSGCLMPPGANDRKTYLETCTKCFDCVAACPHEALRIKHDTGSDLDGYPVIIPAEAPCYMCEDYPCIEACSPRVLDPANKDLALGLFQINTRVCLAYNQHLCFTCYSSCPKSGSALILDDTGKPRINSEHCTGCGICVNVCPGENGAITIQNQDC